MKKIKTRQFFKTLYTVLGVGAAFLLWMAVFGCRLAVDHFNGVTIGVFAFLAVAAISFLAFAFLPYFHGDKRWYAIPSLLTVVFFTGTAMLWQVPVGGVGI